MEGAMRTIHWFFLLNQLLICLSDMNLTINTNGSTVLNEEFGVTSNGSTNSYDGPRVDCLIDTEMGLIAIGTAGGLILCLLIAVIVLACQICQLQRRVYAPRTSRSNMDLVSGTGYWGTDQPEVRGLDGPCDASVMLEEVRADSRMGEGSEYEMVESAEGAGAGFEEGGTAMAFDQDEKSCQMQSSSSRDSCLEVPRDLENMPLVV